MRAEPDRLEHRRGARARLARCERAVELCSHLDVLLGGQRVEQVVGLEYVADLPTHSGEDATLGTEQLGAEDPDAPGLGRAQRADQGQERRLARPRRPGDDHDLARSDLDADVLEDGLAERTAPEGVAHRGQADGSRSRHQNTSAGSAERTLRSASSAETQHIATVSARTPSPRGKVIARGSRVASADTR